MSLTANLLMKRLRRRMPDPVYQSVSADFYMDILMEETLPLISSYYPKIRKGIVVTADMGVTTTNEFTRMSNITKYVIPLDDEDNGYIGISTFDHPMNSRGGGSYGSPALRDVNYARVLSALPTAPVRLTPAFEFPNVISLDPPPKGHINFTVSLQQVKKLGEIKLGYHEWTKKLFEADCKIALYHKHYLAIDGGSYGGIPIKDLISKYEAYEEVREGIIKEMDKDYYKDADRYEEMLGGVAQGIT